MKNFLTVCVVMMVLVIAGCPGSQMSSPKENTAANASGGASANMEAGSAQTPSTPDAAANGGSSLTASAPYKPAGASAQQNVNATPFMVATQPAGKTYTQSSELISRADGTMMGPNDQMAAGTGPGGKGMSDMVPPKQAAPAAKPAASQPNAASKK